MMPFIDLARRDSWVGRCRLVLASGLIVAISTLILAHAEGAEQRSFTSPEDAVRALVVALKVNDTKTLSDLFGPGSEDLVSSGDPVADQERRKQFAYFYELKHELEKVAENKVFLHIGYDDWPFPIPVVKTDTGWRFDMGEGREEILARRIGRNELSAIQVCLAYVDAQREYAMEDRDGDGLLAYAQQFRSDPGKKNGLYWSETEFKEQSPLGPLMVAAEAAGHDLKTVGGEPTPFYGYYYRILKAQGKHAAGGAYEYVVKGKMIGGFALVAYPAEYGASGIMTFMVNHEGVVYQKDLGEDSGNIAKAMTAFDPDATWKKVEQVAAAGKQ
jgi:Protein of unknown function (DUF2950)